MKRDRVFNHPYYWGGFVLHVADGSYRPVAPTRSPAVAKQTAAALQRRDLEEFTAGRKG
jgi:hypothetical protein